MKLKLLGVLSLLLTIGTASATPVLYSGTVIDNDWRNYTLVHDGASPSGSGSRNDWLRFAADQAFDFFYDADAEVINTDGLGTQSFDLFSVNGASGVFNLIAMSLILDDSADGFSEGFIEYSITVGTEDIDGVFFFDDINSGIFNSVNIGSSITSYLWGADYDNDLGIDFAFTGVPVPESATLLLMVFGLLAMRRIVKK